MTFDEEFVIDHPVDAVFSAMADIEQRPRWVTPAQERKKITEGPVGEGTKYYAVDKYPGRRAEFTQEITAYEPNRLLAESWGGPMAGTSETRFFDENGSTRVRMHMEMNPTGLLGLLAPLMKSWASRAIGKDIEKLEALIAADSA